MLKTLIASTVFLYSVSAYAQTDRACLGSAEMAAIISTLMEEGKGEDYVIGILTDPKGADPNRPKIRQKIIDDNQKDIAKWVYTVRPSPSEARSTVYAKCMAGGLGYIDWSKYPKAARVR